MGMRFPRVYALAAAAVAGATIAACSGGPSAVQPPVQGAAMQNLHVDTAPSPTPTPIQLEMGMIIGSGKWANFDRPTGGQGNPVDGITCREELLNQWHHHVHLSIFYNGKQLTVPEGVGIIGVPGKDPPFIYHGKCFYWLHTHDKTGIIHIEPTTGSATFTLGNFFDIWGEPLSPTQVANLTVGSLAVYENGVLQPGQDPSQVQFYPFEDITLVVNSPTPDWIPNYLYPPGYP
jgi:hypothetical protein